jgi:hypothetical protein
MNDDEYEAQMLLNLAQSSLAMEASHLEHEQNRHDYLCFHVQMCSIIAQDDEMINGKCLCLKNFGKKSERKF